MWGILADGYPAFIPRPLRWQNLAITKSEPAFFGLRWKVTCEYMLLVQDEEFCRMFNGSIESASGWTRQDAVSNLADKLKKLGTEMGKREGKMFNAH